MDLEAIKKRAQELRSYRGIWAERADDMDALVAEVEQLKAKVEELLSYLHYDRETESHRDWVADCQDLDAEVEWAGAEILRVTGERDEAEAKIEAALAIGSGPAHVRDYQLGWDACRAAFREALTGGRQE